MKISQALVRLLQRQSLRKKDAFLLFLDLFSQKMPKDQAKAFLLLLARKAESETEVYGCLDALRKLEPPCRVSIPHLMDTCGTGGDASHSFNVSTLAAIVIAGAGGKVAKHGNRGISSKCGSSDLMEMLGVRLDAGLKTMLKSIRQWGIGYFHAPLYHPVFSRLQSLRRELKIRTILNYLGPLVNPLKLKSQFVGVATREAVPLYANLLKRSGMHRALVCHGLDGLDEISTSAPTEMAWIRGGKVAYKRWDIRKFGLHRAYKKDYEGGSPRKNRSLALALLRGQLKGPLRDLVIVNAAAGLLVAGKAATLREGMAQAEESLCSGKAYQALKGLKKLTQKTHSRS